MLTLHKVLLLGTLPEEPKLVYNENGRPRCSFTTFLEENGQDQTSQVYVPVDILGDRAEKAPSR
jgi:hypothetical protein